MDARPPACYRHQADQTSHYSFGYGQPHGTGVAGGLFADSLARSSHGAMVIDQFHGAQLGQEPQALQKIRTGDIDVLITPTANAATLSPESGVMSLHYLFQSEAHLTRALADPAVIAAMKAMFDQNVTGVHMLGLATLGLRHGFEPGVSHPQGLALANLGDNALSLGKRVG